MEEKYRKSNPLVRFFSIVGAVTIFFALCYVVYRLFNPDDFNDYDVLDDDYETDSDD